MIISIKKRDGRIVPFDPSKIEHAIAHCFLGSGSQKSDETAQELAALVVSQLENDENIPSVPYVEQVQDVVERVLIERASCVPLRRISFTAPSAAVCAR